MLESASPEKLGELRNIPAKNVEGLDICKFEKGVLIRVITQSGNVYFFEIVDPAYCRAKVARCETRQSAPHVGYLGERTVSRDFVVGKHIQHENSLTSPASQISIIQNPERESNPSFCKAKSTCCNASLTEREEGPRKEIIIVICPDCGKPQHPGLESY